MTSYHELLIQSAKEKKNLLCMGLDPILEKIPLSGSIYEKLTNFYISILQAIKKSHYQPSIIKPNYAYFEQYGIEGLTAMKDIIQKYNNAGFLTILDSKRGDIGSSSQAYANAAFDIWNADAITVSPYMGTDSVTPFFKPGKGTYILCRTSNQGSSDFQNLKCYDQPLYIKVLKKILSSWFYDGIGIVLGATHLHEMEEAFAVIRENKKPLAILIPGIGTQGGDIQKVQNIALSSLNPYLVRINASSSINYAYLKHDTHDFAQAAVTEIIELSQSLSLTS